MGGAVWWACVRRTDRSSTADVKVPSHVWWLLRSSATKGSWRRFALAGCDGVSTVVVRLQPLARHLVFSAALFSDCGIGSGAKVAQCGICALRLHSVKKAGGVIDVLAYFSLAVHF